MDATTRTNFENLTSEDGDARYAVFENLLKATEKPVDWAYDVWDQLLQDTHHKNNHVRAIATQMLCNLAKSDPRHRMLKDFDTVLAVTHDERFVTARHTLQALWKVGAVSPKHQKLVVDRLAGRFQDCAKEKNCTLIRYDIIQDLRKLYDQVKDEKIRARALELIQTEPDLKYRKKYATLWRH